MVERGAVAGLGFGGVILEWGIKIDLSAPRSPLLLPAWYHVACTQPPFLLFTPLGQRCLLVPLPCADGDTRCPE